MQSMSVVMILFLQVSLAVGCGGEKGVEPRPQQDLAPTVVESFEAQTLTAERERLMIDFATAFRDPEGQALRYTAESSNQSVLMVSMSGSILTITPLAEGSASVSVKATDPGGNSATITISVTVNPPAHPDDDENYHPLSRLIVTADSVEFFELSARGSGACIEVDPQTRYGSGFESGQFQFHHSRWQRQDGFGWSTIPGTVRNDNRLCVYSPTESGLYRMVGDVTIVGHGQLRYSSNVLNYR